MKLNLDIGYLVEPEAAARNLGGKTLLWGNINPMLMLNGTKAEVKLAARKALEAMATDQTDERVEDGGAEGVGLKVECIYT